MLTPRICILTLVYVYYISPSEQHVKTRIIGDFSLVLHANTNVDFKVKWKSTPIFAQEFVGFYQDQLAYWELGKKYNRSAQQTSAKDEAVGNCTFHLSVQHSTER